MGIRYKLSKALPDWLYLKIKFKRLMHKNLDLHNPKTFNEKLQWLKIYDRKPEYTMMVDKYEVKKYVADKIGKEYIIPTLGVWDSFDQIDFDSLPDQFVLKCTHDSGGLVICRNKHKLNKDSAKRKIEKSLRNNFYWVGREWPYKNVKPRIIAEKYIGDNVCDYKLFCFNGITKCFKIDFDRFISHHANYYDCNSSILHFGEVACPPVYDRSIIIPENIREMISLSEILSRNIPFLRVDFYNVNGHIYFGELTFYPASGFGEFEPAKWDVKLGEWIKLPENGERGSKD